MDKLGLKTWNEIAKKIAPIWTDVASGCGEHPEQIRATKYQGAPEDVCSKEFVNRCHNRCFNRSTFLEAVINAEKINGRDTTISTEVAQLLYGQTASPPVLPAAVVQPPQKPVVVHSPPPKIQAPVPVKCGTSLPSVNKKDAALQKLRENGVWTDEVFGYFAEDMAHKWSEMAAMLNICSADIKNGIGSWATPKDCSNALVLKIRNETQDIATFKKYMRQAAEDCEYRRLISTYNL